tara:strand:- start:2 stop:475 length:474 start_codon:yes stop_codon:yes gene_type:complete
MAKVNTKILDCTKIWNIKIWDFIKEDRMEIKSNSGWFSFKTNVLNTLKELGIDFPEKVHGDSKLITLVEGNKKLYNFLEDKMNEHIWHYVCHFEDGMDYHYKFDKKSKKLSRYNMTSTGMNSFCLKNCRFPIDKELVDVEKICLENLKKTFKNEFAL